MCVKSRMTRRGLSDAKIRAYGLEPNELSFTKATSLSLKQGNQHLFLFGDGQFFPFARRRS